MSKNDRNPMCLEVKPKEGETEDEVTAKLYTDPVYSAASAIKATFDDEALDITALADELRKQSDQCLNQAKMTRAESMLISQAHTLDTLFHMLIRRSKHNMSGHINAAEKYMRLALKSQSQCRTTLMALSEIKNPAPFIQNNRAQYQQVNNNISPHNNESSTRTHAPAREKTFSSNELLTEDIDNEKLDTGRTRETVEID